MKTSGTPISFPDAKIMVYAAPKAACTSIKLTLASSYAAPGETDRESLHRLKRNERGPDYLRIAFCRDPIEKIRSIYVEKLVQRKAVKPALQALGFYKNMPVPEYVDLVVSISDEQAEKHLRSQYLFLYRDGPPDVLIKFEHLSDEWKRVKKIFKQRGGKQICDLMRLNVSLTAKPHLTEQMKASIAGRYRQDIASMGYSYG